MQTRAVGNFQTGRPDTGKPACKLQLDEIHCLVERVTVPWAISRHSHVAAVCRRGRAAADSVRRSARLVVVFCVTKRESIPWRIINATIIIITTTAT